MDKPTLVIQPITKKNILIFITTIALYTGYILGNRWVFILGEFFLLVLVASFIYSHFLFRQLKLRRDHYPRTFEGADILTSLYFQTDNPLPHYMLEAIDTTPPAQSYYVGHLIQGPFNKNNEFILEHRLHCVRHRGVYNLGPINLYCADPLGIFPRQVELPIFTSLLVYPQAVNLPAFQLLGDGTLQRIGIETILTSGESEEFIGVREYVHGDPPGKIHWKLSAHHRKLIVKEFKENTTTEISIFLDLFRLSMSGLGDMTTIEYIIKACAAIARAGIDKAHQVQVFAFGSKVIHIPLGGGTPHLLTILDKLTLMRASGDGSFAQEVKKQIYKIRHGATAVFIVCASSIQTEEFLPILRHLYIKHVRTIIVLIDDRSFIKLWREQELRHQRAMPIFDLVSSFLREGAEVYVIACREKLEEKLITPKRAK